MSPLDRLKELNTRDCLWTYVLRILQDGPMHGYAIRSEIEERFGFRPGNVTSYKVIYLLKRSSMVSQRREGRKIIYEITQRGKDALREAVEFYKERAKVLHKP